MCNLVERELQGVTGHREILEKTALKISSEYGVECTFCKLISRRWSFYAGSEAPKFPERRIEINSDWGVVLGGAVTKETETEIVNLLKSLFGKYIG